ncbi:hypothetical protein IFM89_019105 [Coptis chinensis]|uniref:Uncharacterized protein n=1 Tax=Coptis chinensis TaxID=261450 RepID=A0A835LMS0_9MAGN|nr:hypothetical protein IFM89_019105 [Coptis chinensis]
MDSSGGEVRISAEEFLAKLKDDGDFDKPRLKIIQKLKENTTFDAIHKEIGNTVTVTGQISDALWGVIRSTDGMKSEINNIVESVYNRLLNENL